MNNTVELDKLIRRLGITWRNYTLLETALTHTSFANEHRPSEIEHNQRLEFLGDAVLELVISDYLYQRFPSYEEGLLTKIRAAVVCETALVKVAQKLSLGPVLRLGRGEERTGGRRRPAALADAFESLLGALYLDQGLEAVRKFILDHLTGAVDEYAHGGHAGDFKSELQEWVQQYSDHPLSYVILEESGPDHNKVFTAGVQFRNHLWGTGAGRSKKEAEQAAAENALQKLREKGGVKEMS